MKCFWRLSEKSGGSFTWVQLLKLRFLTKKFISCKVGIGKDCSFWFDNWIPYEQLLTFIGFEGPRIYGIPIDSKISFAVTENGWNFRGARRESAASLLCHLTTIKLKERTRDRFKWRDGIGPKKTISDSHLLGNKQHLTSQVEWHKEIWFFGHIPKHAFIL